MEEPKAKVNVYFFQCETHWLKLTSRVFYFLFFLNLQLLFSDLERAVHS